jgi:hypothetical protein
MFGGRGKEKVLRELRDSTERGRESEWVRKRISGWQVRVGSIQFVNAKVDEGYTHIRVQRFVYSVNQ